jgi:urea transport system substrate-binding protein
MEAAYIGVKLWAQAVEACGSTEPLTIRDAMLLESIQSPGGPVRFDPVTQHLFKTPRIGQIQSDGQFSIEWVDVKPVAPMPYPESRSPEQWTELLDELYLEWNEQWAAQP